ncbi:Phosphate-binding protein PstS precursor [Crateriforma conspicua]|uniref:Phosphate-binding protein n=2 Tax=Planctomycetaceae TaxID=126 RepID=A0A5C6FWJ8_9PLAN|nr:Phosphate-binding protein PstS precursor [Crateriforma conspicua]
MSDVVIAEGRPTESDSPAGPDELSLPLSPINHDAETTPMSTTFVSVLKRRTNGLTCGLAALALAVAGCNSSTTTPTAETGEAQSNLVGNIEIDGSSTVQPISNAVQEQFRDVAPGVSITVSGKGTGNGFKRFALKETDISGASRPIKPSELESCREAGVEFVELPVAYDGLTFVIHPENDWVESLTVEQLTKIFADDNPVSKWNEIDESWPDETINIFAPGTGSGTYDYTKEVLADEIGLRKDMSLNEDDNILVQGVAGNRYSIGFFGVAYFEENQDKLKAVPIVNPEDGTAYMPTTENISGNKYAPFSRPLFIYVNAESLDKAEVATFVDYYLTNVPETCEKVGYVKLPEELLARARENYENVVLGTHYVDESGEKRGGPLADIFVAENLTK